MGDGNQRLPMDCYKQQPALSAVYTGAYTRMLFLRAMSHSLQFASDASDDDDDDIDAALAEPAHASSSATSTSAAGGDVSSSTQPFKQSAAV